MSIIITARSRDSRLLDDAIHGIITKAKDFGVHVDGPLPIPTKNSRDSKDSTSRTCIHGRIFRFKDATPKFIKALGSMKVSDNINFTVTQS